MDLLASYLLIGIRSAEPTAYPDEVTIVALNPTAALAVACVTPGYPGVVTSEGDMVEDALGPVRLQAYLLSTSRGLEDSVTDTSYRVSDINHRPAENCGELDDWAAEWDRQAEAWAAEGEIWGPAGQTINADQLCEFPPPDGPDECPKDWWR